MIDQKPKPRTPNQTQPTMNKTHETPEPLAAIIAEMRGNEFDDPHPDADGIIGARRLARDWADRIEAAAKRERAITDVMLAVKDKPLPHPDPEHAPPLYPAPAAAIREALMKIRDKCVIYNNDLAEEIDALCGNALAAPARNADRFQTAEEAYAVWQKLPNLASSFTWLFAPAEGGAE